MREFFMEWGGAVMCTIILVTTLVGAAIVEISSIDTLKSNCQALIAKNASAPDSCFKN